MTTPFGPRPARRLGLEPLELRDVPVAGGWLVEPFQRGPAAGMPAGWARWSSDNSNGFAVDSVDAGLGDTGFLASNGTSTTSARAWLTTSYAADVEASASVFLSSAAPVQLFVRGQNLGTTTPSYYAAAIARGGEIQVVKVVRGVSTVLGTVRPAEYVSGKWVEIKVRAEGDRLKVFVHRGDTNQYLAADGTWTRRGPTPAVEVTDTSLRGAGQVGFARPPRAAGEIAIDSLRIGSPEQPQRTAIAQERFARGAADGLPPGWSQWSAAPDQIGFRTTADETLRVSGPTGSAARAWLREATPADVQVSSSVYVDSLVPAGVLARGQNLYTNQAAYYSLTAKRGLEVQLSRVEGSRVTPLGTIRSADYVSGLWVQLSLVAVGDDLRVQVYRADTGQYLSENGTWGLAPAWAMRRTDSGIRAGGPAGLTRGGGAAGELVFDNVIVTSAPPRTAAAGPIPTELDKPATPAPPPPDTPVVPPTVPPTVPPPPPPPPTSPPVVTPTPTTGLPDVPRNYSWIRVANLAYYGTPFGDFETSLLRNSVDLVIPNTAYLGTINAASPTTPQFVYTNVSNIYLGLYTDWLAYADRNRLDREGAFFHVTAATAYTGMSASAVPVNQLWGVQRGSDAGGWTDVTRPAWNGDQTITFGSAAGDAIAFGQPEKYRELTFDVRSAPAGGWAGRLEYVKAVDAQGKPTSWGTLNTLSDGTAGFRRDGTLTFDPPRDWVASSVNGSARLFYVRVRTTTAGTAPTVGKVTGRDYTNADGRGAAGGTIPAFDAAADRDGDGYLNAAEYTNRRRGFDARFEYESRMFYPTYGPNRFATNVSDAGFRAWAADYHSRVLRALPEADGFFVDNANGKIALDPAGVAESLDSYAADSASLLGAVNRRLSPKWVIANTAGGGRGVEELARNGVSYLEEFGLRPVSANHVQFDDLAASLAYRRQLSGGKAYEILDSLPVGLDANDPRVQLTTLAMYYTLADPNLSLLMLNGGNEPASGWDRHWTDAITYNVGRPTGAHTLFATGNDPANTSLVYKVYKREYQNAIVLYKPLSYTRGTAGTTADNTRTTHDLGGTYRPLRADGSLGAPVTRVSLRNGEGMILVRSR